MAQVLLTRTDLVQRSRYVNSYRTFRQLLQLGVIPVVNENDTVAVEELKFGDNDTLSAQVASLVGADWLFLLTDVEQLYSADPRSNPDAQPIYVVDNVEQLEALQVKVGDRGSQWGTGGMMTKIEAARIATTAGVRTVITEGRTTGKSAQNPLGGSPGHPVHPPYPPQQCPQALDCLGGDSSGQALLGRGGGEGHLPGW
jgi:glutamate 5-kinase